MRRLFWFKRKDKVMWSGCCMRTSRAARSICKRMKFPFLYMQCCSPWILPVHGGARYCTAALRWQCGRKMDQWSLTRWERCIHGDRGKIAYPVEQFDEYVKHIITERNQEADGLANLGTEGKTKMTSEGVKNTVNWKATRGYWDGNKKRRWKEWVRNCDQSC